jgi:hypothetical protein
MGVFPLLGESGHAMAASISIISIAHIPSTSIIIIEEK